MALLTLDQVTKTYVRGRREVVALREISLELDAGEIVGIWGRRFSGRTTLLRIAGGLERPDHGRVLLDGNDLSNCRERDVRGRIAFSHTGFSRAHAELVVEHVAVPLLASGARIDR